MNDINKLEKKTEFISENSTDITEVIVIYNLNKNQKIKEHNYFMELRIEILKKKKKCLAFM